MPPNRSSKMCVSRRSPPPITRQPPNTRSAVLNSIAPRLHLRTTARLLEVAEERGDEAVGARMRAVNGPYLVHCIAKREVKHVLRQADRVVTAVATKGTLARQRTE